MRVESGGAVAAAGGAPAKLRSPLRALPVRRLRYAQAASREAEERMLGDATTLFPAFMSHAGLLRQAPRRDSWQKLQLSVR
jgi:hypothetical protein